MFISVVTTLYHSSAYIAEFHKRILAAIQKLPGKFQYEMIFVDDGSPDDSLEVVEALARKDKNIRIVALSRNFGHAQAMMTGLSYAGGDLVFLIDVDLEEQPEFLFPLYQCLTNKKKGRAIDVAYALQESRKGGWFEKISGSIFWRLFSWLTGQRIPYNQMTSRLMTRRYVQSLVQHEERELFVAGLMNLTGYRQEPVLLKKGDKGRSTYTLAKKVALFINAITSFSQTPLIFIFVLGTSISLMALASIFWVIFSKLFLNITYLSGWASLILITCFFGGLTLAAIGAVGIYLGKVFMEVKKRPCIVKETYPPNWRKPILPSK